MGFHICQYCGDHPNPNNRFNYASTGDVTLTFSSGNSWEMPDMILHYIADHHWQPPPAFVDDVLNKDLTFATRLQTKSLDKPIKVGYLDGELRLWGNKPTGFVEKLEKMMESAVEEGQIAIYRNKNIITLNFSYESSHYTVHIGIRLPEVAVVIPDGRILYLHIKWETILVTIDAVDYYRYPCQDLPPVAIASIIGGLVAEETTELSS